MNKITRCLLLSLGMSLAVSAQASIPGVQNDGLSLPDLQGMYYHKGALLADDEMGNKRTNAMRDAAMAVGAQHAYVETMNQLRLKLNSEAEVWDNLFPFKDLMRVATTGEQSLYFLPAVIHESSNVTSHSDDNRRIEVSEGYMEIIKPERLVTNAPDWREYLLIDMAVDVSKPVAALLPKTPAEQALWADSVAEGWQAGALQANAEMVARMRNLGSDFIGMVRYLRIAEQQMLSPAFVSSQHRGKVNQGSSMHLNQRTFAITAPATFQGDDRKWIPLDLDPRAGFRTPDERDAINRGNR